MGATTFGTTARGKTAREAFTAAVTQARFESGSGGYSGTIAEKRDYVMIALPAGRVANDYARELIDAGDPRIDDKWGPAGCIALGEDKWLFFGWASE